MDRNELSQRVAEWVDNNREQAIDLVRRLVRINSVNQPPTGNEAACQLLVAELLKESGAEVETYALDSVPGLRSHTAYMEGRSYENRPNVVGLFRGAGGPGKSIMFSSHVDTVYEGNEPWTYPPFSGEISDGKLYGRGSYDMKGGLAASMMAVHCLRKLGITLNNDVFIESVVDEEHGGANGTLAGRLRGPNADVAVIPEPTNLRLYPAHLGGGIWKAEFTGKSGIGFNGEELVSALDATVDFARLLREFGDYRRKRDIPPAWWKDGKQAEVVVLSIYSGDHSRQLQEKVPATGVLKFWIEAYPGVSGVEVINDLLAYYETQLNNYPTLRGCRPTITPMIRFLEASEMPMDGAGAEFLGVVRKTGERALGKECEPETGSPFACDGFMFNLHSSTPVLILGPSGSNAHAADEYLELNSYFKLIRWYAEMMVDWCGIQEDGSFAVR